MKAINTSFLFFCLFLICFIDTSEAQNDIDSVSYYVKFINDSKKNNDLIDAIAYLKKENLSNKQNGKLLKQVYNLTYIARAQRKMGMLYEGEVSAIEAIKLLDQIEENTNTYRIPLYNFLGILYFEYEDYKTALRYYNKVLEINSNPKNKITILNNIGKVYFELKNYTSAISFYKQSYDASLNFNNKLNTARALDNLGFAQSKILNPDALLNLTEALSIRQELNYQPGIIESYLHLGNYYKDRNKRKTALNYANKAIKYAELSGNIEYTLSALSFYSELDTDLRILQLKKLDDSIKKSVQKIKNKYTSKKYDYDKQEELTKESQLKAKDSEIKLKAEKLISAKKEKMSLIYLFSGVIILISSISLILFLKSKHKKDKIKDAYLKETELSKKVHDELANDMSDLMNFVENDIEVTDTKKSLLLDNIEDIYLRTRDISTETGSIDLVNFSESIKHLLMQHNRRDTKVITNNIDTITWEKVAEHKKMVVFRCLQELMVNMKKHSDAKVVSVVFKTLNNKHEIRYVDDGIGFEKGNSNLNGLANVESRIKGIGGSFNFTTSKGNGFKAMLVFNK